MDGYDFSNFYADRLESIRLESYNPSRYGDRFEKEEFSRMSSAELQRNRKRIENTIRKLIKEQEEEAKWSKPSYVIKERIAYEEKLLRKIDTILANRTEEVENQKRDDEIEKILDEENEG